MLLDIELSRQGMERERGWVGRISYENNEVDAVLNIANSPVAWLLRVVKGVVLSKIRVGFMLLSKKAKHS